MDLSINCGPVIASRKAAERLDFLIKDRGLHQLAAFEHFLAVTFRNLNLAAICEKILGKIIECFLDWGV